MRIALIVLLQIVSFHIVLGQERKHEQRITLDSIKITFAFSKVVIVDSNLLTLKVIYRNITNNFVEIYKYLAEGDRGDRFFNINVEMQKLQGGKYVSNPMSYYQNPLLYRMEDSLRHYDLPKRKLAGNASDTLEFNLLKSAKGFLPGKYRFKVHLRVKTIRDETEYNDKNFEVSPPMDKLEYVSSGWFYFVVKKEITLNFRKEPN